MNKESIIFNKMFAQYYDLIYENKPYKQEVEFYDMLINKFEIKKSKNIVSLASGTINHERHLLKKGYNIHCIEKSVDMITYAKKNH